MGRGSFFDGVSRIELTHGEHDLAFPIFYYEASAMTAVFPARIGALRRMLPDPRFVPARVAPGVGAVAISCFEYRDTEIGPYNELAISALLHEPAHWTNLPGRSLLGSLRRRQMHAFVMHLPVTTEIALAGGRDFYNFPKFIGRIEFDDVPGERICRLSHDGEQILTLTGARIPAPERHELQLFSHLWMDRQPQSAEFRLNALEYGASRRRSAARVELGSRHAIAGELDSLLLACRPVYYQYMPSVQAILHGPEHLSFALLARTLNDARAHEAAEAL